MKINAALIRKPGIRSLYAPDKSRHKLNSLSMSSELPAMFSLLAGLCCGVLLQSFLPQALSPGLLQKLTLYFGEQSDSFGSVFRAFLAPSVGLGLLILLFGTSIFGTYGVAALLFLRGCGLGALSAYLVLLGKAGIACYFTCLFPGKVLQLGGLFLLARLSMKLCRYLKSCLKRDSRMAEPVIQRYLLAALPGQLLLVGGALVDLILYWKISPSFASLLR